MSANPPKNDAWRDPRRWWHVWVNVGIGHQPPAAGLVLRWDRHPKRGWQAWVILIDEIPPVFTSSTAVRPVTRWASSTPPICGQR